MSKNVFANGREVSAAEFQPDPRRNARRLMSPPPPAGPVPIPYPNFASASDTTDGARSVHVGGDEVGIKSDSNFKQCNGDEAATKSFGMNVGSHCIQGKTVAQAWSFDVKFEGKNALRLLDLTTNNNG